MSPPRRTDFADAADYAWALWEYGGPWSPEAVWFCARLGGWHGDLLRAVLGDDKTACQEWLADLRVEAPARPHIFLEKLTRGRRASPPNPNATVLSVDEVGEVLSAAEFAHSRGWLFGTSLTLSFTLMGADGPAQVKETLKRFLKCLAQWCRDNDEPRAFIAVVENSARIGLHAHVVLHVSAPKRRVHRAWVEGWVRAECTQRGVAYERKAWRLNRSYKAYPLLHDTLVHYVAKGCDSGAMVQAATDAPDGGPVLLRDVLAFDFCDPGAVPFERVHIGASINARARGDWRSKWERGERDVNLLYTPEFVKFVRRWCPVATLADAEIAPVRAAALALAEWHTRVKPLGDALPPETLGWQTVVERNVEIATTALCRVHAQFAESGAMRDPQDRRRARAELRRSVEAAHVAVNENGDQVASLVEELQLPLGRQAVGRLAAAEAAVRVLGDLLGVTFGRPAWAAQAELYSLAI